MSRLETTMTIGTSIAASAFSHVFCCGILPFALNASAGALLNGFGAQIGLAVVTSLAVATGVTCFEKYRHETACVNANLCGCAVRFDFRRHLWRNIVIGGLAYGISATLSHLPEIHHLLDALLHIRH